MVERLVVAEPEAQGASDLSVGDRDRIVAELLRETFGSRVMARLACGSCEKPFGVEFSLDALVSEIDRDADERCRSLGLDGPDDDGFFRLESGARFRLPTLADERALSAYDPALRADELLERCCPEPAPKASGEDRDAIERALAAYDPLIATPVPARCAWCGAEQEADFDVVSFFSAALARERPLLVREIHTLARAYGWSFEEIANLPRDERRAYVELVETERGNLEDEA